MFYDMHRTPSVYSIMHTSVVNPFEVPITDKRFSNDLALSTHVYFSKIFHYLRYNFLFVSCLVCISNLFHCDKLFNPLPSASRQGVNHTILRGGQFQTYTLNLIPNTHTKHKGNLYLRPIYTDSV